MHHAMLVLLVEDDLDLAELVVEYLESESIECDIAYHGLMGLELIKKNRYSVIIIDIMMPRMNGLDLCASIRKLGVATPCLILTARDTIDDKLAGFEKGADDYMVKPFDLKELVARIYALSKRHSNPANILEIQNLSMNTMTMQAKRNQRNLSLSPIEWKLLERLMRESPNVISREQLTADIWCDDPPSKDTFKTQIYRLRKIVDVDGESQLLHTLRGKGIVLRLEV